MYGSSQHQRKIGQRKIIINMIGNIYRLKEGSFMKPMTLLGAAIKEHQLPENPNNIAWSMNANKKLFKW